MTVLVAAASKHGATLEIAETIAHVLEDHGIPADLVEIDDVDDLGSYDAYIVFDHGWVHSRRAARMA